MSKLNNLAGQKFGCLSVIERSGSTKRGLAVWHCRCDCGKETDVIGCHLLSGQTKSCGHLRYNSINFTHRMSKTRLYRIWRSMRNRCFYQKHKSYSDYGGRGITVCSTWEKDFQAFFDWAMKNGYSDNLTIDRIDYNGNYEPSNCRWATMKVQENNRRNNHLLTFNGDTKTLTQWSVKQGIGDNILYQRLRNGWSIEKALLTPVKKRRKHYKVGVLMGASKGDGQ